MKNEEKSSRFLDDFYYLCYTYKDASVLARVFRAKKE